MDSRLSYMYPTEDNVPHELVAFINPVADLQKAFEETEESNEMTHLNTFLRIRPLLVPENNETKVDFIEKIDDNSISVINHSQLIRNTAKMSHHFTFSHVYGPESNQVHIFEETTEDLVSKLFDGHNCLMFTYGATNSGKTFTMQGTDDNPGLLPRTLFSVFNKVGSNQYLKEDLKSYQFCNVVKLTENEILKEREVKEAILKSKNIYRLSTLSALSNTSSLRETELGNTMNYCDNTQTSLFSSISDISMKTDCYSIFISFAEIYNEYVYDLLERFTSLNNNKRTALMLGEDKQGSIYIKGLKHIKVSSVEEALKLLEVGRENLHFALTKLNQNSSRSHCIFTIKLIRLYNSSNPRMATTSMLSLCDLAGAERTSKTLNSQDRLREASNINTSLLVLGRCIAALRHNQCVKNPHTNKKIIPVPYRDSKITRLFQSFFMGKGVISMIVNISPSIELMDETLKVLKFSAVVQKVAIIPNRTFEDTFARQSGKGRFSHFIRQSINASNSSIRLSVAWANSKLDDVTFGTDVEIKDCKNESRYEEEFHEHLLELIKKLRDRLVKETKEKQEMEEQLRKDICDAFNQRLVEIEQSTRTRLEEERSLSEELMDWRVNTALDTQGTEQRIRKRRRMNEHDTLDGSHIRRDSFNVHSKIEEIEKEKILLQEELTVISKTLMSYAHSSKLAYEENSKLKFELAVTAESLDKIKKEKEIAENGTKKTLNEMKLVDSEIFEKQKHNILQLEKEIHSKEEELLNLNTMLKEAAEEFMEKEEKLQNAAETIKSQNDMITLLENQLFDEKEVVLTYRSLLDERDKTIFKYQKMKVVNNEISPADIKPVMRNVLKDEISGKVFSQIEDNFTKLKITFDDSKDIDKNLPLTCVDTRGESLVSGHYKYESSNLNLENNKLMQDPSELLIIQSGKNLNIADQSDIFRDTIIGKIRDQEIVKNDLLTPDNKTEAVSPFRCLKEELFLEQEQNKKLSEELSEVKCKELGYLAKIDESIEIISSQKCQISKLEVELDITKRKLTISCDEKSQKVETIKYFERSALSLHSDINKHENDLQALRGEKEMLIKEIETSVNLAENLTNKVTKLDKDLMEEENNSQCKERELELIKKELAAVKEARRLEDEKFQFELKEKEIEIESLQKEIKDTMKLQLSNIDPIIEVKTEKITKDYDNLLKNYEIENNSLIVKISELQKSLDEKEYTTHFEEASNIFQGKSFEETYSIPTSTRSTTKKTKGKKKNNDLSNPHIPLENKENNESSPRIRKSARKKRPLYNTGYDTLEDSPNLTQSERGNNDSPHTLSRRQLRSTFK